MIEVLVLHVVQFSCARVQPQKLLQGCCVRSQGNTNGARSLCVALFERCSFLFFDLDNVFQAGIGPSVCSRGMSCLSSKKKATRNRIRGFKTIKRN